VKGHPELSGWFHWPVREFYFRRSLKFSRFVITDSETTNQRLIELYNADEKSLVDIGLLPANHNLPASPPIQKGIYFIYPANKWSHKNHRTLLHALKIVVDKDPRVVLVLTGSDKGFGGEIEKTVRKLNLENHVIDLGFVDEDKLRNLEFYAVALVMPTLLGPTNVPPLDALNLGTPAIVSDVHNFEIVYQQSMTLVPALDEQKWAEEMISAIGKGRLGRFYHSNQGAASSLRQMLNEIAPK
jgi:glycosyltransferase involved in cell wall biosynthesis